MTARGRWTGPLLVLATAAVASFWGLTSRDLTGDEISTLGGSLQAIFENSYAADRPDQFSAHLPLFAIVRLVTLNLLPEHEVLARRLPTALGACLGALLLWWSLARHGRPRLALAAGLLLGVHPLLSFHAHDSSNYALAPLTGALVLAGLADLAAGRRGAAVVLGAGLLLGTFNDYFFAFVASSALAITVLLVRRARARAETRRMALRAWGAVALAQLVPLCLLLWNLAQSPFTELAAQHADIGDAPTTGALTAFLRYGSVFVSSSLDGYTPDHEADRYLLVVALSLLAAGIVRATRTGDRLERTASLLLVLTIGQVLVLGVVFTLATGRLAPLQPRAHMALLPALIVVWLCGVRSLGPRGWVGGAGLLLLLLGSRTVDQLSTIANTRERTAERITSMWAEGDAVVSIVDLGFRLPPHIPHSVESTACLPSEAGLPTRLWVAGDPGGTWPELIGLCGTDRLPLESMDPPYVLSLVEHHPVPRYEVGSGSFLTGTVLYLFDRLASAEPPGAPFPRTLRVMPLRLAHPDGGRIGVDWLLDDDRVRETSLPLHPETEVPTAPRGATSVSIGVFPSGWSRWPALGPLRLLLDPSPSATWSLPLGSSSVNPALWTRGIEPPPSLEPGVPSPPAQGPVLTLGVVPGEGPRQGALRRIVALLLGLITLSGTFAEFLPGRHRLGASTRPGLTHE